jgi:hypothetical protein
MNNQKDNLKLIDIINYFSKKKKIDKLNENNLIIKSYPRFYIDFPADFNNLFICLLIADKNINICINHNNRITIESNILFDHKNKLLKSIKDDFNIDFIRKKKIISQINDNIFTNDVALVLSEYFYINLIIFFNDSNLTKIYYNQNELDPNIPFIIINYIKDINSINYSFELIKNNNKFYFDYKHPIITELLQDPICIGLTNDKSFKVQKLIDYTVINELELFENIKYVSSVDDMDLSTKLKIKNILENSYNKMII